MSHDQQNKQDNVDDQRNQIERPKLICKCQEDISCQQDQPEVKIQPVSLPDPPADPEEQQGINEHQNCDNPGHHRWNTAAETAYAGDAENTKHQPDRAQ